jgi:GT2 family glycosyltransferase
VNVAVVILTYKRDKMAANLVESLSNIKNINEIILVDNSPSIHLAKLVEKYDHLNYIEGNNEKGTFSRNYGLKSSKSEIIICLDDDLIGLDDNAVNDVKDIFNNDKSIGAVCFKILSENGNIVNWCHHKIPEKFKDNFFETSEISEGAVAFNKKILSEAGYYSDDFFISHEGFDLALRIIERGAKIIYSPNIKVIHSQANEGRTSWRRYYYDTRNLFLVWTKNMQFCYGLKYILRGLIPLFIYSIRDGYFFYYLKGIKDGIIYYIKNRKKGVKLKNQTIEYIRKCKKDSPGIIYLIKKRLFRKGVSI